MQCIFMYNVLHSLNAQTLPIARNYQQAYNKQTRSTDGKPGKNYWQNTASYKIDVSFDPAFYFCLTITSFMIKFSPPFTSIL